MLLSWTAFEVVAHWLSILQGSSVLLFWWFFLACNRRLHWHAIVALTGSIRCMPWLLVYRDELSIMFNRNV